MEHLHAQGRAYPAHQDQLRRLGRHQLLVGPLRTLGNLLPDVRGGRALRELLHVRRLPARWRGHGGGISSLFRPAHRKQLHEPVAHPGGPADSLQLGPDFPERKLHGQRPGAPHPHGRRRGGDPPPPFHRAGTGQRQHARGAPADLYKFDGHLHGHADRSTGERRQHQRVEHPVGDALCRPYRVREYQLHQAGRREHQVQHHQHGLHQRPELHVHQRQNRRVHHRRRQHDRGDRRGDGCHTPADPLRLHGQRLLVHGRLQAAGRLPDVAPEQQRRAYRLRAGRRLGQHGQNRVYRYPDDVVGPP